VAPVGLSAALVNAWRRHHRGHARIIATVRVPTRSALPQSLRPRRLYLIGDPPKWAVLICPCGRGHVIDLNLGQCGRPRWSVSIESRTVSVRPSIDVRDRHRCHFWITHGVVRWCMDDTTGDLRRRRLPWLRYLSFGSDHHDS
jgi:hypothetical protein